MTPKIMPVQICGAISKCMSHPSSYRDACKSRWSYSEPTKERIAAHALQQLESARAADIATHEQNLPAIENNKAVVEAVEALMREIGMPREWSERAQSSRARYPKMVKHPAGFITDLAREVKTDDGFVFATRRYEEMKRQYTEYAEEGAREAQLAAAAKEREREAERAKRLADMELAAILLRYKLPLESTWHDVLEALRAMDQRLDLAVAMRQTRGDWSGGCYRVTDAIRRFTIRTDEDKEIAADVLGCTAEFEDGRVFRDTTWSYDRLFASVQDQQLAADTLKAMEHIET